MNNRRLATILSIDVVGYSKLMQTDASGLLAALNSVFRSIVKPQVAKAEGRIVKLLGDGAIAEFPSAYQALVAAAGIQTQMRDVDAPYMYDQPLFLRIGVHVGDIIDDGNDIFGDGVILRPDFRRKRHRVVSCSQAWLRFWRVATCL